MNMLQKDSNNGRKIISFRRKKDKERGIIVDQGLYNVKIRDEVLILKNRIINRMQLNNLYPYI